MTRNVAFSLALSITALLAAAVSANAQEAVSANAQEKDGLNKSERLLIQAQRICPVTGKDLTTMGGPVKAKLGEENVYLCCKGCLKGQIKQEHWEQIQANLAVMQGKCPVLNKSLPKNPKSVVVDGRRIFVCCSPCTKKIEADSKKYISVVDRLIESNLDKLK